MMQAHEIQCKKNQGNSACECDCYLSRQPKGTLTTGESPPTPAQGLNLEEIEMWASHCQTTGKPFTNAAETILELVRRLRKEPKGERPPAVQLKMCGWVEEDPDADMWKSQCGQEFVTIGGSPKENGMHYCCHCGGMLYEDVVVPEPDDEEESPEPSKGA